MRKNQDKEIYFQEQNKEDIERDLENFVLDYIKRSDKLNTLSVSDKVDSDATLEGELLVRHHLDQHARSSMSVDNSTCDLDILIELEEEKINCTDPNSLKTKNGCKCRLATKDVGFGCR